MTQIQTTFSDIQGDVRTIMTNDGSTLRLNIDGIEFVAMELDCFKQVNPLIQSDRFKFDLLGILTNYVLSVKIPIKYETGNIEKETTLDCCLKSKMCNKGYNETTASCTIQLNNETIKIDYFDSFESLFEQLNRRLNYAFILKCCYNCLYSDYSVSGQGFWGTMLCFNKIKDDYLKVKDKNEYIDVMEKHLQFVQETFLCNEFKKRIKGTGYRG